MNINTQIKTVKTLYRVVRLEMNTLRHKKYNEANSVRTQSMLIYFLYHLFNNLSLNVRNFTMTSCELLRKPKRQISPLLISLTSQYFNFC